MHVKFHEYGPELSACLTLVSRRAHSHWPQALFTHVMLSRSFACQVVSASQDMAATADRYVRRVSVTL